MTVGARKLRRWTASLLTTAGTMTATLAGLLLITFFIGRVMPIDPVAAAVGAKASASTYTQAREEMGLDRPLWIQFTRYAEGLAHGDFGRSTLTSRPVMEDIARVFPATLELSMVAILIGVAAGVPLGVAAARHRNRWPDHVIRCLSLVGYSLPIFWLGLIALLIFYADLHWVGGPGRIDIAYRFETPSWSGFLLVDTLRDGNIAAFRSALAHLVLPALLLGYFSTAYLARMTRGLVIEELSKDYVLTALLKGASQARLLWRHVLPNLLVPLVTVVSLSLGQLLEGAVLTETVFAWPGLGLYITNGLFAADLPAVLGGTLVVGTCFILLNKGVELLYPMLDPRVRSS